jgi:hypothetical protein
MTEALLARPVAVNEQQPIHSSSSKKKHFRGGKHQKKTPQAPSNSDDPETPHISDPRFRKDSTIDQRLTKKATKRGTGRNTESFDPSSTWVRPALRIRVGSSLATTCAQPLRHDDVVIVPELFGPEENWDMYYQLMEEMKDRKDWTSWHEGAHLIVKHPDQSPTFQRIVQTLCDYFQIRPQSLGVRFNWYKDSSDWKPFHHDSAAFNPQRARTQNITVGASFGACRELAFLLGSSQDDTRVYFPQPNNGVFSFGRDVNIRWKHGINAVQEKSDQGRVSIIVWGLAQNVIEEEDSPPLLGSDGQGPHAAKKNHSNYPRNDKKNCRRNYHHSKKNIPDKTSADTVTSKEESSSLQQTVDKENHTKA